MVAALLALGACEHHGPIPGMPQPGPPAPVLPEPKPPAWWRDRSVSDAETGRVTVCAMADDVELLRARRRAVERATAAFAEAAGGPAREPVITAVSVKLPEGLFRAYVRLGAKRPDGAGSGDADR